MEFYHGTTLHSARAIIENGFRPRGGAIWFTNKRAYARNRAEQRARRKNGRPVIIKTELAVETLKEHIGIGKLHIHGGTVAVNERLSVACRDRDTFELLASPESLSQWINRQAGLYAHNGVSRNHWGVVRLAHWMNNRLHAGTGSRIHPHEFLAKGQQWLPAFFGRFSFSPERFPIRHLQHSTIVLETRLPDPEEKSVSRERVDERYRKAVADIADACAKRRVRGLRALEKIGIADLFEWCVLQLEDESVEVVCNALRTMQRCADGYTAPILVHAGSENKRVRASALAALAKHAFPDADAWFERGLKDSETCVRMEVARLLPLLDRSEHARLFEIARHDPNPEVKRRARKRQ